MQLQKSEHKFDIKTVEKILLDENRFITNLLNLAGVPNKQQNTEDSEEEGEDKNLTIPETLNKKSRAKSLHELEERLKAITSKKKLSYKEKLVKKGLKNRLKKKSKQDERNAKSKLERASKLALKNKAEDTDVNEEEVHKPTENKKPVFNSENKLVFSKIDFANLGQKKIKKHEKDPKKILQKLTEEKNKLQQLEQEGETEKVVQIKEKSAWKNALAKAEGQKVKDDPILLKKSVEKREQKVRSSKKKWEARIKGVENAKQERQKKRSQNIDKRKKDKKNKKLKAASKKGKIIPGF